MEEQNTGTVPEADQPPAPGQPEPAGQPSTGDPRVDEAVGRLAELAALPAAGHPAVFEYVHRRLEEALGDLGPGSPGH